MLSMVTVLFKMRLNVRRKRFFLTNYSYFYYHAQVIILTKYTHLVADRYYIGPEFSPPNFDQSIHSKRKF